MGLEKPKTHSHGTGSVLEGHPDGTYPISKLFKWDGWVCPEFTYTGLVHSRTNLDGTGLTPQTHLGFAVAVPKRKLLKRRQNSRKGLGIRIF